MSRKEIITNFTTELSKLLFQVNKKDVLISIWDGTYVDIQKSADFSFQRKSFCTYKGKNLLKMMVIVSTNGRIIESYGLYLSDGNNNDSSILLDIFEGERKEFNQFFKDEDIVIVDRGFRDCVDFLSDLAYQVKMPHFLYEGNQHDSLEANESRIVTALRWVIESINGVVKTWKYFQNKIQNLNIPYIGDDFSVCSLINKCKQNRLKISNDNDQFIATEMLKLVKKQNTLKKQIENLPNSCRRLHNERLVCDLTEINFPHLSEEYIRSITFGIYQLKQAKSYTKEHLDDEGDYYFEILLPEKNLLRIKLRSRFRARTIYNTYIQFSKNKSMPITN